MSFPVAPEINFSPFWGAGMTPEVSSFQTSLIRAQTVKNWLNEGQSKIGQYKEEKL